ncbi:hypothetical protein ACE1TI_20705 [Alteribacillus sp. JSM 102045]|uniref:hypothetical protein n=1 Tax=Alteribacillus sp. JSM 102045 TaxID=1562101 RepID=UPI0035C06F44
MQKEWLSSQEVSKRTDIPLNTVNRYLRIHGHYLKFKKQGNSYRTHRESLPILSEIRRLYHENYSRDEVDEELAHISVMTIDVVDEQTKSRQSVDVATALHEMRAAFMESINEMNSKLESVQQELSETKEENIRLRSKLTDLNEITTSTSHEVAATRKELESVHTSMETVTNKVNSMNDREWSTLSIEDVRQVIQDHNQNRKKWYEFWK